LVEAFILVRDQCGLETERCPLVTHVDCKQPRCTYASDVPAAASKQGGHITLATPPCAVPIHLTRVDCVASCARHAAHDGALLQCRGAAKQHSKRYQQAIKLIMLDGCRIGAAMRVSSYSSPRCFSNHKGSCSVPFMLGSSKPAPSSSSCSPRQQAHSAGCSCRHWGGR
jgi:hypothetical protein